MIQKIHIPADIVLLVSRLIIGGIFVYSAWVKFADIAFTVGSFGQMGIPAFIAYVVMIAEMLFGICLVLGVLMSLSTLVLSIIMIFAIYYSYPMGFMYYVIPLAVLGGTLALHATGAGKYRIPVAEQCR